MLLAFKLRMLLAAQMLSTSILILRCFDLTFKLMLVNHWLVALDAHITISLVLHTGVAKYGDEIKQRESHQYSAGSS